MEKARLRALTQSHSAGTFNLILRRNGKSPTKGIDT